MVPEEKPFRVHCTWVLKKNPSQSMHLGAEQILQNPCTWCCCCEEMPSCNWVQKKSFRICAPRCCGEEKKFRIQMHLGAVLQKSFESP
jgi:hypothetical protein